LAAGKLLTNIVGVKFKKEGKVYSFDADDLVVRVGDTVVVKTDNGVSLGIVVTEVNRCRPSELPPNLKKILRKATPGDMEDKKENEKLEEEAKEFCREKIKERNLPMKLIEVYCQFDRSKMMFYFSADSRVDFRDLIKDLVQKFKTRIELKQIGARQEARVVKGMGICGRMVCCAGILQNLERVTVKMAKEQSISLNPEKISGLCGRLMCCLAFEYDKYTGDRKSYKETMVEGLVQVDDIDKGLPEGEDIEDLEKLEDDNDLQS